MNKKVIKEFIQKHYLLYSIVNWGIKLYSSILGGVKIANKGHGRFALNVIGKNNTVMVGKNSFLYHPRLKIRGSNNKLIIGENCKIRANCGFQFDGNGLTIVIGDNTSIQHDSGLHAQNASIFIGKDCMFSNHVFIRTSDSHPIYNSEGIIINSPKDVKIEDHVWIAASVKVLKGSIVGSGSVIGGYSVVTKCIPSHAIAVGIPARVVKEDISWERSIHDRQKYSKNDEG